MSLTLSSQTLLSLKEGDVLFINSMNDYGKSNLTISYVFDGGFGGTVRFEDLGEGLEDGEYGELYEEDFHLIYDVEIN